MNSKVAYNLKYVDTHCYQHPPHVQQILVVYLELMDIAEDRSVPADVRDRALAAASRVDRALSVIAPSTNQGQLSF